MLYEAGHTLLLRRSHDMTYDVTLEFHYTMNDAMHRGQNVSMDQSPLLLCSPGIATGNNDVNTVKCKLI